MGLQPKNLNQLCDAVIPICPKTSEVLFPVPYWINTMKNSEGKRAPTQYK